MRPTEENLVMESNIAQDKLKQHNILAEEDKKVKRTERGVHCEL